MNVRDLEYIWNRLASPCGEALEAHGRLQQVGYGIEAGELMVAMQHFMDETRRIRKQVSRRNAGEVIDPPAPSIRYDGLSGEVVVDNDSEDL